MRYAVFIGLLVGCHGQPHEHDDTGISDANFTREAVTDGGWVLRYTPDPDPLPQADEFTLSVVIEPPQGVTGWPELVVDAEMPAHGHGMNTAPETTAEGEGAYTVEGMLFHMPGHWRINATLTLDGASESAHWDVDCCS